MFKAFRIFYLSLVSLLGLCGAVAIGNYTMTQGAGTTFGSIVVGGTVHYAQQLLCDLTTPAQCAAVSAAGAIKVDGSAVTQPVSLSGVSTAANQTSQITQETATAAALGTTTDAVGATPSSASAATLVSLAKAINNNVSSAIPAGTNTIGTVGQLPYPVTAVPYTATATGTTAATTATLTGAASVTTYLCGFSIRANATAAATGNATVTGVITATLNFTQWTAPNASGLGITEMIFSPCIPASGTNQSVAVVSAAPGTGGVVSVTAWGYKL